MKFLKENYLNFFILSVMIGFSLFMLPQLPGTMALIDVSIMPTAFLILILSIVLLVKLSPQKFAMPNSQNILARVLLGCGILFMFMHVGIIFTDVNSDGYNRCLGFGFSFFMIIVGNVFGKLERNFFIGVRVPWTLASEENWRMTHRFGGKVMVVFGVAMLIGSYFTTDLSVLLPVGMLGLVCPVVYSYFYYNKYEKPLERR